MSRFAARLQKSVTGGSPSGVPMPVGNLPGWTQVVAEDFNDDVPIGGFVANNSGILTSAGSAGYAKYLNRITTYPDGWSDTYGFGRFAPSKTLSVSSSIIDIHHYTDTVAGGTTPYPLGATIKPILPSGNYAQTFGRYTYRMRTYQATQKYYGAVVLLIDSSNWPQGGELDFPEGDMSGGVVGNYHKASSTSNSTPFVAAGKLFSDWHTYVQEWTPGNVKWYVDGQLLLDTSNGTPPSQLAFLLQSCTTGNRDSSNNPLLPDPAYSCHVQVDWMCIYSYTP